MSLISKVEDVEKLMWGDLFQITLINHVITSMNSMVFYPLRNDERNKVPEGTSWGARA